VVVVSEHNTAYNNEEDTMAGHLWGDGAAALLISKERLSPDDLHIAEVITGGAAPVSKADEAVTLKPVEKGIVMPFGRDVFQQACIYMARVTQTLLDKHRIAATELTYLIPHQANLRISKNVTKQLGIDPGPRREQHRTPRQHGLRRGRHWPGRGLEQLAERK
jgi:3-oxoacyl-[acyl-carrier-protein] synthase-3